MTNMISKLWLLWLYFLHHFIQELFLRC